MTMTLHSEVGRGGDEGVALFGAMSLSPEAVGERIESARKEKRWSRLDLATAMDVSPSSIYRWEIGRLPSVHELMRLAGVLDKPVDTFTEPPERQLELADLRRAIEEIHYPLEELATKVDALATRDELQRGLDTLRAAIDALANPSSHSDRSAEQSR